MQISLRVRLDSTTDRLVIEFEPSDEGVAAVYKLKVEGMAEPAELNLDPFGYIVSLAIPGLAKGLAALAGEKQGKAGKNGH